MISLVAPSLRNFHTFVESTVLLLPGMVWNSRGILCKPKLPVFGAERDENCHTVREIGEVRFTGEVADMYVGSGIAVTELEVSRPGGALSCFSFSEEVWRCRFLWLPAGSLERDGALHQTTPVS